MKFIELTGRQLGKLILLNVDNFVSVNENSGGFTTVYCVNDREIQVRETPREIADLIKGIEKPESEWIENTGHQPCANNRLVAVLFADGEVLEGEADNWKWEKGNDISVVKYKFK